MNQETPDHHHAHYMRRALELASLGSGNVSPNPLVGCVIVHNHRIIGEGWHRQYGQPHAEVNAIDDVGDKSLLREATLYVTLEPCTHHGKTPPCADLIIQHKINTVVIAHRDSNPLVAGKGIAKLQAAGINVIADILSEEAGELNRRFFTYMEKERPRIILKWAETADGFIARSNNDSRWISDKYSRQLVHKWRAEEDAVLVGPTTASYDNPMLSVRNWTGRHPARVLIDRHLRVNPDGHLFDGTQKTICYNLTKDVEENHVVYVRLPDEHFIESVVADLYKKKIQSVIVEGGAQIIRQFVQAGLWDEARIFLSPKRFGVGIDAPAVTGIVSEEQKLRDDRLRIVLPRTDVYSKVAHSRPQ